MASRPHPINDGIQPPTGRWHRATGDRHLHPSESLPSSNHILLARDLYFARPCSNSHTCALACHKYIALDGVATRIENQQGLRPKMTMMPRPRPHFLPYLEQQCSHRPCSAFACSHLVVLHPSRMMMMPRPRPLIVPCNDHCLLCCIALIFAAERLRFHSALIPETVSGAQRLLAHIALSFAAPFFCRV